MLPPKARRGGEQTQPVAPPVTSSHPSEDTQPYVPPPPPPPQDYDAHYFPEAPSQDVIDNRNPATPTMPAQRVMADLISEAMMNAWLGLGNFAEQAHAPYPATSGDWWGNDLKNSVMSSDPFSLMGRLRMAQQQDPGYYQTLSPQVKFYPHPDVIQMFIDYSKNYPYEAWDYGVNYGAGGEAPSEAVWSDWLNSGVG